MKAPLSPPLPAASFSEGAAGKGASQRRKIVYTVKLNKY